MKQSLIEWIGQGIMAFTVFFFAAKVISIPVSSVLMILGIVTYLFGYKKRKSQ